MTTKVFQKRCINPQPRNCTTHSHSRAKSVPWLQSLDTPSMRCWALLQPSSMAWKPQLGAPAAPGRGCWEQMVPGRSVRLMEVEGSTSWTAPARSLPRHAQPRWLAEKSGASWSAPLLLSRTLRAPLVEISSVQNIKVNRPSSYQNQYKIIVRNE